MSVLRGLATLDRLIHEPVRLAVMAALDVLDSADQLYLLRETGASKGNLSAHLSRLEEAGYVAVEKTYRGRVPHTVYRATAAGRSAFAEYLDRLRTITDRTRPR